MRDQVFAGRDVPEAVAAACQALGLAEAMLRYVVLERGAPGALGMGATPARIAVLLDGPLPPATASEPGAGPPRDPRAGIEAVLRAVAEAAGVECGATVEETEAAVVVRLSGPGLDFFLAEEGEVLKSLEHLLQRMFGRALDPRRLSLDAEGYREQRDDALRALARELAAAVRADGTPRTTRPLNSYERRIVHVALTGEPGVQTYSVGEGGDRCVTVAPSDAPRGDGPGE